MSLPASNELTSEELDAMEQQAAAAAPAPPSGKPLAMGPVQQLDPAREYSPEELELYQQATELSPDDLDEQLVSSVFDDPTYLPTREEYFAAREAKTRLTAEGKIPGLLENAATGATGFIQTLGDMVNEISDFREFDARGPATMQAFLKKSWRNTNDLARWIRSSGRPDPIGRDEVTGEFIFGSVGAGRSDADVFAGEQQLALQQGRKIRPVTDVDLQDFEYDFFMGERQRQKELEEWVNSTTARTNPLHRILTGRDQTEQPMQATSDIAGGLVEATNIATMGVPLAAGAKSIGFSRLIKAGGSRTARVLENAAQTGIEGMETGAARFQNLIQRTTRLTPETQTKIAQWSAAGGVGGAAFGLESEVPGVSQVQDAAKFIGSAYVGYKLGLGTLRTVQKVAGPTATILRVAADPADGLDPIAQASVATKLAAFPELSPVREVLENPTRFRAIESTPARLAADPRLGPQTRAVMEGLANPLVVQGVRGASAVAGGAIKGAAANTPFVALALNAEEEKAAASMLGMGAAFGAAGGAMNRVTGVRQRRAEARASDIGRMLMDVELAGGDVAGLAQTYSPQQLGDVAAMQGIFRNRVEFVPLNQVDYDLNVQANGGVGSAGMFIQAPAGGKARVFVNLDAKRDGVALHEFGHALLSSGALSGAQAAEIRVNVNRRYTQAGVEARATEYARNLIAAQNEKAFPGQNLPISQDAIRAKLDELGQSGLLRGDLDTLDWARDELFAEEFRTASANLDFAAIRRGLPADGSWLGSFEKILGGHANALSISGIRIDPATGAPIDTPQSLFRDNPVLAADKTLVKNLDTYIKNYRQWVNHPEQTKPRGVRVAPTARPQDLANNPQVTFHDLGNGVRGNEFATLDPATGQAMLRSQAEINAATTKRQQQMRSLVGSKLLPATDPNLGPKKTADGRVTIRGRQLPQQFDFLSGFAQHVRGFARQFEQHAARGESMQVRYHAIGTSETGSFRIKNLGNLEAITREVIPWGWELTSKGNLMASMLDLTQFRNRALRAINDGNPQMQLLFGNDMTQVEATLKQWMDNHRADLPGDTKIGAQKRDAINALVGIGTTANRAANPFSGKIGGPGSAIKQFRLDRVDTTAGTGRVGFHFDYDKANGNLLPEVATPLPDLSRDLPTPRGQAMPDAVAPNGKLSNLNSEDHALVRTPEFKAWAGDWEALADLSSLPQVATKKEAVAALIRMAGQNLTNLSTGKIAQINSQQRGKLASNKALASSMRNGFTAEQHNAAAANIDLLWKHAEPLIQKSDKNNDPNIAAIQRFAAPFIVSNDVAVAYMTVKESMANGHRIYSVEITEMRKLRGKGDILEISDTTPAVFDEKLRRLADKVNPKSITIKTDGNGEPSASEVARFRQEITQYPLELRKQQLKGVAKVELLPPPAALSGSPTDATTNETPATTDAVDQAGSVGTPGSLKISSLPPKSRSQGQAMPDAISDALPRRGAIVKGKAEVKEDGSIYYNGKEPSQWSAKDFEAYGREFGVRNLGPLSKLSNIVDELGRPLAQVPGGLDGKFTYYDLLYLKANPVDVKKLPVDLHGQLTAKLARTMTPDRGNNVQKFNGILFGMLSPNSPLLPNEFGQARMRFGSMDEIKKFADLLPDNPTKEQRQAVNKRLKNELGFTSAGSGGLGIGISVDLSNIVMASKLFVKNPDFFIKKPKESWANFVDKLTTQVSGLGTKTASFGGVWQDPLNAGISAMDRHMARAFSEELVNNPDIRGRFEGIVVNRFNDLLSTAKKTAKKADAKIRNAKSDKARAKAEQDKADAMQNLPDPTALKADTLDDVLGQAEIFGGDRIKDFINEAVFAAMGSRKAKYQMKSGEVNPNLPESIQGVEWVQTPKDFQVMSEAYRLALEINAKRAKSIGIEIFPAQWTLWDGIRGRVEPHEAMFPGLEKLPTLNDRQLSQAFSANKRAGYAATPKPGQPWRRKSGISPSELAYFGIPFAAAALTEDEE